MTESALTCAECGGVMLPSREPVPFELRGEKVTVPSIEHMACQNCGEMLLDLESVRRLQKTAADQVRRARGLLASEDIRALRLSLGLSQAGLERLLGTGPKTVVRWEKGVVFQSATADRLMRVIMQMPEVAKMLRTADTCASPG